jgi:1,4-alpha-glucan branching enzyme
VAFLLHTHMPYVRRNGDWPVGEEWLLEAWAETYLPLLETLRRMAEEGWGKLAVTLTPILAEQLEDPYMQEMFQRYLENKLRQCEEERVRLERMGDGPRRRVNRLYFSFYDRLLECWGSRYRGRMRRALRGLSDTGRLEVLASAATHAFLPLLASGADRERQVRLGLRHHREWFGGGPCGFWLPELAWSEGMGELAGLLGLEAGYVVLNFSALPPGADTSRPCRLEEEGPPAILRDRLLHDLVWTWEGIPSHAPYREFHKRDLEGYGFQYWRISGPGVPLDGKETYRREEALARVEEDASLFVERLAERAASLPRPEGSLLLAAYDTEIFGHWWFEGMRWLEAVLRRLEDHPLLELTTPGEFIGGAVGEGLPAVRPPATSWGRNHDFSTWLCPQTEGFWSELRTREAAYREAASLCGRVPVGERALRQALRELLLLEASDWPYMMGQGEGGPYARERFQGHCERFDHCLRLAREGREDGRLAHIEEQDNPFRLPDGVAAIFQ